MRKRAESQKRFARSFHRVEALVLSLVEKSNLAAQRANRFARGVRTKRDADVRRTCTREKKRDRMTFSRLIIGLRTWRDSYIDLNRRGTLRISCHVSSERIPRTFLIPRDLPPSRADFSCVNLSSNKITREIICKCKTAFNEIER